MPARQDMKMNVEHRLSGAGAVINDHPVSLRVHPFVFCDFFCRKEQMPDKLFIFFGHTVNFGNMLFGNNERMHGGLGIHVFKGGHEIVFVNDFGRDFFCNDLAENAVWILAHYFLSSCSEKLLKKQLRSPVWHAGPVCSTLTRSVS